FISDTVTNRSYRQRRVRYRIPVVVAAGIEPAEIESVLLEAAGRSENVLPDPPPRVLFREFGEQGLRFELLCWTTRLLHSAGTFRSEINHLVYEALRTHGIAIPSAQLDVRIRDGREGSS
ncbi:MAG TPA: mechanosensitive ion channel family protein, partial [Thermoanaerobaculia bacterium]|nr:mechanosensitive ion channel family protein [Thermoanaerobaculia bacterium]